MSVAACLSADSNGKLHHSWIRNRAGDAAKGGGAEAAIGLREGGSVGDVEHLRSEFQSLFHGTCCVFDQREVEVAVCRAADRISRGIANGELGSGCEGAGVEVLGGGSIAGRERWPADDVGPLQGESREGVVVRCLGDRDGHSGLERKMVFSDQPPSTTLAMPVEAKRWPRPAGRS